MTYILQHKQPHIKVRLSSLTLTLNTEANQKPDPIPALIREMAFGRLMDEVRLRVSQDVSNYETWKQWVRGAAAFGGWGIQCV